MQIARFLITFICCFGALTIANCKISEAHLQNYKDSLPSHLSSGSLRDLPEVYYKVLNLVELGGKSEDKIVSSESVCGFLRKIGFTNALDAGLGAEFITLNSRFGCPTDALKSEFNTLLKAAQRGDKLNDIFHALQLIRTNKALNGTEAVDACSKVVDLIREDGMSRSNKRSGEYSYANTIKVLETLHVCKALDIADSRSTKRLETAFKDILSNARSVRKGALAFIEGDFFLTTTNLLSSILSLSPEAVGNQQITQFIDFLRTHEEASHIPEKALALNRLGNLLKSAPVVELENRQVTKGKETILRVKLTNILGDVISQPKIWKVKGAIHPARDEKAPALVNNMTFEKKADNLYEYKLAPSALKKLDLYQLRLTVSTGASAYEYTEDLIVKGVANVQSIAFEVTKSPDRPNERLHHVLKAGETLSSVLAANQGNYVHIAVKLDADSAPVGLVGARFTNSKYRFATGLVAGKLDKENNLYRIVIDLGDPDHILPYNGQHNLELIVSGELIVEPLRTTLASFDLSFIKPAEKAPASDADITLLPEIQHQFPPERRKPNVLLTTIFNVSIVVIVLGFFAVLAKLKVNLGKFPQDFVGQILALAFMVLVLGLFGSLALFWLKINIFETLLALVVLAGPTVFIGDLAIKHFRKPKEKAE